MSGFLLDDWRRLLAHVPPSGLGSTTTEVYTVATWWPSSRGQVAHALRQMRERGLVESPSRGRFRLTQSGREARSR